jgi:histidinol-phosphate aminotransferase
MRAALNEDWSLPDDLAERVEGAGCRLLLLVSPHAPSGAARPLEELEAISRRLRGRAVLLIDEAYVDFAEADALPLLHPGSDHDNVLVLRTLSKGYSLAGLRFGYGLGHPDLIAALDKARDSYNTDVLAQAGAVAALQHREDAAETWQAVREERDRLAEALQARGYEVVPSQSNFLLAGPPPTGPDAATIYRSLKRRGVLVRYFDQDRLRDKLRITVGTPQQNDVLLRKLDAE